MASPSGDGRHDQKRRGDHADRAGAGPVIVRAKLAKHATADGLCEFVASVPIGTVYLIDLATKHRQRMLNTDRGVTHEKEIVREYQINGTPGGWLPLECLELLV